jgi:hypothetical protein
LRFGDLIRRIFEALRLGRERRRKIGAERDDVRPHPAREAEVEAEVVVHGVEHALAEEIQILAFGIEHRLRVVEHRVRDRVGLVRAAAPHSDRRHVLAIREAVRDPPPVGRPRHSLDVLERACGRRRGRSW